MFCVFFVFLLLIFGKASAQNGTATEDIGRVGILPDTEDIGRVGTQNMGKIVGGVKADIEDIPYQAILLINGRFPACGGSIITDKVIVTAAHCENARPDKVRVGSAKSGSGGQVIPIASFKSHHGMIKSKKLNNDIGLVFLKESIQFGKNAKPIKLPMQGERLPEKKMGIISGFGLTKENGDMSADLRKTIVPIIPFDKCVRKYYNPYELDESMFCAGYDQGGKDACQGDSGGPLAYNGVLLGVTSWGIGCARAGYPGVYTYVALYNEWIHSSIKNIIEM